MQVDFGVCRIELVQGDITAQKVDAIVNAANKGLRGGGGVDGAIHRAGGKEVMADTRRRYPDGCPTGQVVPSVAGELSAKFIFHAVGPIWTGGQRGEENLLASCYQKALQLAVEFECESIAFPAISTGVYGYPIDLAAETTLTTIRDFIVENTKPREVRLVLFRESQFGAFARVLETMVE